MKHLVQRCLRDRDAGVALMFAVTVIPIIGIIGIAVDLGYATQAKTQLNAASDAAALAAAKGAADAFSAGDADYINTGKKTGTEWFKSQASSVLGPAVPTPSVTVTQSGAVFSAQVTYQSTVAPFLAPLFGITTVAVGGSSSATITTTAYVSVTFLLDNSSSMLVAATQDGVKKLGALTLPYFLSHVIKPADLGNKPCAFACHWDKNNNDYYGLAKTNGIQLRFDVLQDAVASAIKQMKDQRKIVDQFAVSIYTFSSALTNNLPTNDSPVNSALLQVYPSSIDLESGAAAAKNIKTPVVEDMANTDFPSAMSDLAKKSTRAGDGSSTERRKKALIIVTDGLVDIEPKRHVPDTKGPLNPDDCAAMKSLGYNVYVLYTTFVTSPLDFVLLFNTDLLPYLNDTNGVSTSKMAIALQACASAPTNFAQASDPTAIKTAMTQMLQAALGDAGRYVQ